MYRRKVKNGKKSVASGTNLNVIMSKTFLINFFERLDFLVSWNFFAKIVNGFESTAGNLSLVKWLFTLNISVDFTITE